ncbi:MAG: GntR family transcriptional regulator [Betaproteobacteria bacterium]|nr:GntR family transcriptional regulator [Betaproteobacteria bacterium]
MPASRKQLTIPARAAPRYLAVAEALARAITSGRHPVGSMLPTEAVLCEGFCVSRHTIRESLRRLRDMGLVARQQGVGTRVLSAERTGRYVASLGTIDDVWRHLLGTTPTLIARSVETRDQAAFALPAIGGEEVWQRADILRSRGTGAAMLPISIARIYINNAFGRAADLIAGATLPAYALIEREYGQKVIAIAQQVSALALDTATARLLQAAANTPALAMRRVFRGYGGVILQVSRTITPADRFVYGLELRLKDGL